jgi:hypothetical protein
VQAWDGRLSSGNQQQFKRLRELQLTHSRFIFSLLFINQGELLNLRALNLETRELSETPEQVGSGKIVERHGVCGVVNTCH